MARVVRQTDPSLAEMTVLYNDLKAFVAASMRSVAADMVSIAANSSGFASPALADPGAHNDRSEFVLAADASTTALTSIAAVNEMLKWYKFHMADTLAHKVAGVALTSYVPVSIGDGGTQAMIDALAVAILRANDIKAKYETHRASTTHHYTADSTNTISASNATDQTSLNTLLVELKADLNLHGASGVSAKSVRAVGA